jgi:hypothetical protein
VLAHQSFATIDHAGNVVSGPRRYPRNLEQGAHNSIHNDEVAQKLGMRGGTVAGNYHMEQFPPLLVTLLGPGWWQTGNLSLYFRYATTDNEGVQCFGERPPLDPTKYDMQIPVWIDHEAGHRVAEGTAAVGAPDTESTLRTRIARTPPAEDIRILEHLSVGDRADGMSHRVEQPRYQSRMEVIVEPLVEYTEASPWGVPVLPPSLMVDVMYAAQDGILKERNGRYGVGLFGGIELQLYDGPMFLERTYDIDIEVLAIGETPKTEYLWYESKAFDQNTGNTVAGMLMMLRFMKASSSLWR